MGKHLQVTCEKCGIQTRSNNLKRHQENGGCDKQKKVQGIEKNKEEVAKNISNIIKEGLKSAAYQTLKHVYFRTDKFVEGKEEEDVLKMWNIYARLKCSCGHHDECKGPHSHLLGTAVEEKEYLVPRLMKECFNGKRKYTTVAMDKGLDTFKGKADTVKHFIHTVCYIQTARGWHRKTGHDNPHTFRNLEDCKEFLALTYSDWMWAQVHYIRYLQKEQERRQEQLDKEHMSLDAKQRIKEMMEKVDEKLLRLEARWGEEHHYKDEELMADLDQFIQEL
jgi:hypothetical protein